MIRKIYFFILKFLFTKIYRTHGTAAPISFRTFFTQRVLRINASAYWPMHFTSTVSGAKNIITGVGTAPGLSPGCYIQGIGQIFIGDYTLVGPNVGIISANHDISNTKKHTAGRVVIGKYCWIGMNSVILPNVELGDHVIVAAGSVVTKSFPDGYCVIGGNPARVLKKIDPVTVIKERNKYEYVGYIPAEKFHSYRKKHLNV